MCIDLAEPMPKMGEASGAGCIGAGHSSGAAKRATVCARDTLAIPLPGVVEIGNEIHGTYVANSRPGPLRFLLRPFTPPLVFIVACVDFVVKYGRLFGRDVYGRNSFNCFQYLWGR